MERNNNRIWRSGSEVPAVPNNQRSRMERTIQHLEQELTKLLGSVGHLAYLVEARAALHESH